MIRDVNVEAISAQGIGLAAVQGFFIFTMILIGVIFQFRAHMFPLNRRSRFLDITHVAILVACTIINLTASLFVNTCWLNQVFYVGFFGILGGVMVCHGWRVYLK